MKHEKHCNQTFIRYLTQKDTQHDTVSVIYIKTKVTCLNIFKCFLEEATLVRETILICF